jgi:hypothetical protein
MSWSPNLLGGANWQGNSQLATKNQLLSTATGLYGDIQNINFSTISVSTLTVPDWISTGQLYVSDIIGFNQYLSGNLVVVSSISAPQASFNVAIISSLAMKGFDSLLDVDVSFDFGLGQAIGGLLGGLGGLIGGGLIAVGTGAGLAIQGAEQGIATMIAGRPENYINSNVYETINFTTQLQVSTLGNAYPLYSSIFRTVSSIAPDQVPGREIFTSTFFNPGQICVRSVSDPFNLITGDAQINSSTIQSFGQWVPLEGLEPENIQANSVSTNFLSTNLLDAELITALDVNSYGVLTSNLGVGTGANFNFMAGLSFDLGSSGDAVIVGDINQWNFQTDQPIVFSQLGDPGLLTPGAILTLGTGAESEFYISSIYASGNIQANTGYFSSLVVNELIVVSTFSTIYSIESFSVLSTGIVSADLVSTVNLQAEYISPFTFSSLLGNPNGPFDINKFDTVFSTTYDQMSSLQQNILNYSFTSLVQDEPIIDIGNVPGGVLYEVTPQNVSQWGSTILQYSGTNPGTIDLGSVTQWGVSPGQSGAALINGATFDVFINPSVYGVTNIFNLTETSNTPPYLISTLFGTYGDNSNQYKFRMTLPPVVGGTRSGWWELSNGFTPYATENNNTFQIYQDINDAYISATDRLHLVAGDILLDGTTTFSNVQTNRLNANSTTTINLTTSGITANTAFLSTISCGVLNVSTITASNITVNPLTGGIDTFYYKSSISFNDPPTQVTPLQMTFKNDSPDFIPVFGLLPPFIGNNYFTSYNVSSWNNTLWNNTTTFALGVPYVFVGDLQQPLGTYSGFFYINNTIVSPAYSLPVYTITSAGSNLLGNIAGNTYAKIQTTNGTTWTLVPNIANPVASGGAYTNSLTVTQATSGTQLVNTQNLQIQAPNTTMITGTMSLYADQIRVNSHRYGFSESTGLNSYPIGIENNVYIDSNISWTYRSGTFYEWYSDATNVLYNITNTIFYDYNSWIVQVIPSRFRTNGSYILEWDVQPTVIAVAGGTGYCWGYNRYIDVQTTVGGPGSGANNWNWYFAFPRNYCTYL